MNLQISQRMSQGLTMTGQMQQAISLLQYSNTDLQRYIEKEAEENPFIDVHAASQAMPQLPFSGRGLGDTDDIVARIADHPISLVAHVSGQFDMLFSDPGERLIADRFLEALDANGWLSDDLAEIALSCGIDLGLASEFLTRVQRVEPAGLFARDLAECLKLQAEDRGILSPLLGRVLANLPRLAAADLDGLKKRCDCTMDELKTALRALRTLNPKPGAEFDMGPGMEREPDLILSKNGQDWQVELNRSTLPAVVIDDSSAGAMTRNAELRDYAGERLRVARWLRRAVEHRNQTTLSVAAEIVRRQIAFLEHGFACIAPMTLADVADAVGVHESTVSRVTTGVSMITPHGTLPLKRFFSAALTQKAGSNGDATSAAAVRFKIQKIVEDEDPANPLSDDAIARAINDGGPILARRTVAKYRDMLKIPSSFQRKRLARINAA